jgi:hypothetical protein
LQNVDFLQNVILKNGPKESVTYGQ